MATVGTSTSSPPGADLARLRVGIDGRPLQGGYKGHVGRGIGLYAVELVRALGALDDVRLALFFDPRFPVPEDRLPAGAERRFFPPLPAPVRIHERLATQVVAPFARRSGIDVFHFPSHMDAPWWVPRRTVATVHDMILELMPEAYGRGRRLAFGAARALERWVISRAEVLITDSETSKGDIVRLLGTDPARIHVAPLGVGPRFRPPAPEAVAALRARLGLPSRFALYLGGADARKNVGGLLQAFARARERAPEVGLVLAGPLSGDPSFPALLAQAEALGIRGALQVVGFVEDADLPTLLGAAEVFVFPSLYEGFGLPPIEAMACGAPVVSTTGGSLAEVLGQAACLVPPGNVEALAAGIEDVLGDEGTRRRLRERGLTRAAEFSWEITALRTCEAYRHALARAGGARR